MDICEYADVINAQFDIRYYPNQKRRFSCSFEHCEVRVGSCMLKGEHGNGNTPTAAINDYVSLIVGKRIIFNAMSDDRRREFDVPTSLVGLPESMELA